jgi:phosphoglycerate dehydrogenase-like enzyme
MSGLSRDSLVLSQWGAPIDALIRQARPDLRLQALAHPLPWPLPDQARVLLARPFSLAERGLPAPAGWPFGLQFVQLISVGLDVYPRWLLATPGLPVSSAHGSSSTTIANFALASILRVQLRLLERRALQAADWRYTEAPSLAGSRLGLVGFGGIGQALAQQALALGMRVSALRRSDAPLGLAGVERAANLAELLQTSDHLVLVAPGTAQTRHLINAQSLAQVKPGLHLVNLARGSLVDQDALRLALDDGRIGWASLDVTEPEPLPAGHWLYSHPRVWLTPHTCAISPQVQQGVVDLLLQNVDRLAQGLAPHSGVDLARGY